MSKKKNSSFYIFHSSSYIFHSSFYIFFFSIFSPIMDQLLDTSHEPGYYTPILSSLNESPSFELIRALSYHADPYLPWCSQQNTQLVKSIMDTINYQQYIPNLIREFKSSLKKITKNGLNRMISIEKENLIPLSQAWFLIDYAHDDEITILVILLVIDVLGQSIPSKIQALDLLSHLPTLNKSLIPQLKKSIAACLVHVPPITAEDQSLSLLQRAYSWINKLNETKIECIQTISTILSTINSPIRPFLLEQLSIFISRVSTDIFISTSKIFFTLNQLLVGLDTTTGDIILLLKIQKQIIDLNHPFIATYAYDFIGAWTLLLRREDDVIKRQIEQNVTSLKKLVNNDAEIIELCTYINV